jgi:hypothetical protein
MGSVALLWWGGAATQGARTQASSGVVWSFVSSRSGPAARRAASSARSLRAHSA